MRILVAAPYYPPHAGGVESVAREEAERLARRGHDVVVLTTRHSRACPPDERAGGARVVRLPAWNPLERAGVPWPIPLARAKLAWTPDVVLAHGHPYLTTRVALALASGARAPSVLLQHNTFIEYSAGWRLLERANDRVLGRASLLAATRVLAVSDATAAYVARVSKREARVVRNGVDAARFRPARGSERDLARDALGVPRDAPLVVSIRRLSAKNGLTTLLDAARLTPDVRYLVAGSGPDRAALERRAPANVRFTGFLPDSDLPAFLATADAFALPSLPGEGFPLAVLEAMAAGLPVVATESGGHVEILDESFSAVVPPRNARELAEACAFYARDPDAARRAGARARDVVAAGLTWEHHVDAIEAELVAARGDAEPRRRARAVEVPP